MQNSEKKTMDKRDLTNATPEEMTTFVEEAFTLPSGEFTDIVTQIPELAKRANEILQEILSGVREMIQSEDKDSEQIYYLLNKKMDLDAEDDKILYAFEESIRTDISSILNNPATTSEEKMALMDKYMELYQTMRETHRKAKEERSDTVQIGRDELDKKREQHRKILETLCAFGIAAAAGFVGWKVGTKNSPQK